MPHNSRPNLTALHAAQRFQRLRAAGVPMMLTHEGAWFLSGGILGRPAWAAPTHVVAADRPIPLSTVCKRVPDCEHFLPDYQAAVQV